MKWFFRELVKKGGEVSSSRIQMFFCIILGFVLNLIMVYELKSEILHISMWGVLFGSLIPIVGVIGFVASKGFETQLSLKLGDKEINLGKGKEQEAKEAK